MIGGRFVGITLSSEFFNLILGLGTLHPQVFGLVKNLSDGRTFVPIPFYRRNQVFYIRDPSRTTLNDVCIKLSQFNIIRG